MKENRAYRFRIYPQKEQEILLIKTFGCCRFLYNMMLSDRIKEYQINRKMLKKTPAQYKKEYLFLREVDSLALQNGSVRIIIFFKNHRWDSPNLSPNIEAGIAILHKC